ncbi:hypothetical protein CXB51_019518 [Gossypium anomalum]|uniref:Autophagy-related protein 18a n=1 Tax=Gossypium anomalum TaxID=47600 RepID=A0A8J5YNY9_9ROSI|nr:hypothetical protein CXB51_019518 [Gossypium anomalum]
MATLSANPKPNFLPPTDQPNHGHDHPPHMQHKPPTARIRTQLRPLTLISTPRPRRFFQPRRRLHFYTSLSTRTTAALPLAPTMTSGSTIAIRSVRSFAEISITAAGALGCYILALVGGGPNPQYPPNKVMIWDYNQNRCIGELSFCSEVRSVRLRRDQIVVVLEHKIFVYNLADLKLLHNIETIANPKGLCAVSQGAGSLVLVCPGLQKGQVRIEHYASKRTKFIMAHDSRIACFALSQDGQLLATASTKGTLVRVYNTVDGSLLQEVRRGADRAEIYSLAFSSNAQWLAVSSDKGTVHVFGLKFNAGSPGSVRSQSASEPPHSSLSFIRGVLPKYFSSEWSVAQFRLLEGSQYIVDFGHQKNTVVILGIDGR